MDDISFNVKAIDDWTGIHALSGLVLGGLGISRGAAYFLIVATEAVEAVFRLMGFTFFRESPQNVATDILASIAGYEAGRAFHA